MLPPPLTVLDVEGNINETTRRCLELGCGAGLVTCAAARAGFDVTASDYYLDALRFTAVNAWRVAQRAVTTRDARGCQWGGDPRGGPPGLA